MSIPLSESASASQQNFRIGEVSAICRVSASELRFWESEFPAIRPRQTHTGQKLYSKEDVESFLKIRELLYDRKLGLQEAKRRFSVKVEEEKERRKGITFAEIRAELLEIRKLLE